MLPPWLLSAGIKYGPSLLKAGMGVAGGMLSKPKGYDTDAIMQKYQQYMQPGMNAYGGMQNQGRQMMDINSQFNNQARNQFSQMAADRMGQNNLANTQNAARFGGLSGMANAQNTASGVGFAQSGMDAFNKAYQGNMGIGSSLLSSAAGGLTSIGQQMGDSYGNLNTANTDMQNQWRSGVGQNLIGFGMDSFLPKT